MVSGAVAVIQSWRVAKGNPTLNAVQITAGMRETTGTFNGAWSGALGTGVVDVAKLIAAFQ
jgi:hypothetical protein